MKKTISLVLALVMVFAIASSASAITGLINPEATVVNNAPYTDIDLQLIESVGTGFGLLSLQPVAANKAYIYDGVVHFALYYKIPGNSVVLNMPEYDYSDPYALISSDIVDFATSTIKTYKISRTDVLDITSYVPASAFNSAVYGNKWVKVPLASPKHDENRGYSYVIVGSGAVTVAANGTIQADLLGDWD